jgi:hypothetical protein
MSDEKKGLLKHESRLNDNSASEIKLHLDEGCQTEIGNEKPNNKKGENSTCFYVMSAMCLTILLIPLIVYLTKTYH